MTQDARWETARETSPHRGEPSATFPPPHWTLCDERPLPVTTRTPRRLQIVLTAAAVPFWGAAMYVLVGASSMSDTSALPRATGLILMALLAVGAVLLSWAWVNKVVVDRHAITVTVIGQRRIVDLASASRIRVTPILEAGAAAGVLPGGTVQVEITGAFRPHRARADLSETDALAEAMVRWWYARPDLVQDPETARALASIAGRLSSRL